MCKKSKQEMYMNNNKLILIHLQARKIEKEKVKMMRQSTHAYVLQWTPDNTCMPLFTSHIQATT